MQRQLGNLLLLDHGAKRHRDRLDDGCVGGHRHRLLDCRGPEREIDHTFTADHEPDTAADDLLKSRQRRFDVVRRGQQIGERVVPLGVADGGLSDPGVGVRHGHGRAGQYRSGSIGDGAEHRGAHGLGGGRHSREDSGQSNNENGYASSHGAPLFADGGWTRGLCVCGSAWEKSFVAMPDITEIDSGAHEVEQ